MAGIVAVVVLLIALGLLAVYGGSYALLRLGTWFELRELRNKGLTISIDVAKDRVSSGSHVFIENTNTGVPGRLWILPAPTSADTKVVHAWLPDDGVLVEHHRGAIEDLRSDEVFADRFVTTDVAGVLYD